MPNPVDPAARRVVYYTAFEALTRAVQAETQPALVAELRTRCGLDLQHPQREYPPDTLLKVIAVITARCFPGQPPDTAYETLGRRSVAAFRQTLRGRVLLTILRWVSIPRTLQVATRIFNMLNNYTSYEVIPGPPGSLTYRAYHSHLPPPYFVGVLKGALIDSSHDTAQVAIGQVDEADDWVDYQISWTEKPKERRRRK